MIILGKVVRCHHGCATVYTFETRSVSQKPRKCLIFCAIQKTDPRCFTCQMASFFFGIIKGRGGMDELS